MASEKELFQKITIRQREIKKSNKRYIDYLREAGTESIELYEQRVVVIRKNEINKWVEPNYGWHPSFNIDSDDNF